jgi:hypothetical protein
MISFKKPLSLAMATAAIFSLSFSGGAEAATLSISSGTNGNFGQTSGVYVAFPPSTGTAGTNWGGAAPVAGQSYAINSISFIKNNNDATFTTLYIGVYTSLSGSTLSGFLGASTTGAAFGAATSGTTLTWNFSGITAAAAGGQQLYFMFQEDQFARATTLPVTDPTLSIRRLPDTTPISSGSTLAADQGSGIIQSGGLVRADRTAFMTLNITQIPEPSSGMALAGGLSALAFLRRGRR